jgi:hypothetical protein
MVIHRIDSFLGMTLSAIGARFLFCQGAEEEKTAPLNGEKI